MEKPIHPPSSHRQFLLWGLLILSLLLSIGVGAALAIFYNNLNNRVYRMHHRVQLTQQFVTKLQTEIQNLSQPQAQKARVLSEADYLITLANLNLHAEANIPFVIQLLKAADQQIARIKDPSLISLRQAITNDVTALQAVPEVDIAGIIFKINALSNQIPNLPLIPSKIDTTALPTSSAQNNVSTSWWRRGVDATMHALSSVVVIRHAPPKTPFLPPSQQAYLILNIQLKLSEAEWAALHKQPAIYHQSLQQAKDWISKYFVEKESATESVLQGISDLQNISVKPNLPDISNSMNALQKALNASSNG